MSLSASFNTAQRVIEVAMINAGMLQDGDTPNSDQYARYLNRLNDLVNLWQTQGLKLFLLQDTPITLTAGVNKYSLGPTGTIPMTNKPLTGIQGYYLDANNNKRPLIEISWDEWMRLTIPTSPGSISSFFIDKQTSLLNVYFWNTPDSTAATGTAHLLLRTQTPNIVQLDSQTMFPQEWFIALCWGLADDICTSQPQAIQDRCEKRATAFRQALESWDVEDAPTFFQVDIRMAGMQNNNFK